VENGTWKAGRVNERLDFFLILDNERVEN